MPFREIFAQAAEALYRQPGRTFASALSVFCGTVVMVLLMAWTTGFREKIHADLAIYGRGSVLMIPAATSSEYPGFRDGVWIEVSRADLDRAQSETSPVVDAILPVHQSGDQKAEIRANDRIRRFSLDASDHRYASLQGVSIAHGRFYDERDVATAKPVAVIGDKVARLLFEEPKRALGDHIRIDGRRFVVIGVAAPKGTTSFNFMRPDDELVMVPITTAEERLRSGVFFFNRDAVRTFRVYPRAGVDSRDAIRAVRESLGPIVGFHPEDPHAIRTINSAEILDFIEPLHTGLLIYLGILGTITLLIAGVGIANYHLATLEERSVEIAVCRALGARNREVIAQTILETGLVSTGSACVGLLVAMAICHGLASYAEGSSTFAVPVLSTPALALSFFGLLLTGVAASVMPARRVSQMDVALAVRSST